MDMEAVKIITRLDVSKPMKCIMSQLSVPEGSKVAQLKNITSVCNAALKNQNINR